MLFFRGYTQYEEESESHEKTESDDEYYMEEEEEENEDEDDIDHEAAEELDAMGFSSDSPIAPDSLKKLKINVKRNQTTTKTIPRSGISNAGEGALGHLADAIQEHEGWTAPHQGLPRGSVAYRNNNPGNLKYVGQRSAIGKDERGFAIFPSYDSGRGALPAAFET